MSIRSGQSITTEFTTRNATTFSRSVADSTPTGTLYVNGTADAATVTVTSQGNGLYKAAVTLPTLAIGDVAALVIVATVNSITDQAKVWEDTKDVLLDASGQTTFANTSIATVTTLTNLPAITAGWLTAAGIAASALNGKGNWNVGKTGYSLTQAFPSNFASQAITAAGGVTLADGVAHGGTPGSGTATLALAQAQIVNPAGHALLLRGGGSSASGLFIVAGEASGDAVSIVTFMGNCVNLSATGGNCFNLVAANACHGLFAIGGDGSAGFVTDATNSNPILVTTSGPHFLPTGTTVTISGVGGNTAANGTFKTLFNDATSFYLDPSDGSGSYTSGGTWSAPAGSPVRLGDGTIGGVGLNVFAGPGDTDAVAAVGAGTGVGFRSTPDAVGFGGGAGTVDANVVSVNGTTFAGANVPSDLQTIKTQAVTCAAGVTVLASVGTAATSTAQTGDSYALTNSGTFGLAAIKGHLDIIYGKLPDGDIADEALVIAATDDIITLLGTPAQAAQIPAAFTDATFESAGVFSTGALANAPTGGGTVDANLVSINGTTFAGPGVPSDRVMFGGVLGDQSLGDVDNVVLPSGPSGNGVLVGSRLRITSGVGQYQERTIRAWEGATKIAGIDHTLLAAAATAGDTFVVLYDNSLQTTSDGTVSAAAYVTLMSPTALGQFFTLDSGQLYADAVAGSVVKEIGSSAGGGELDAAGVRAAVGLAAADLDEQLDAILTEAGTGSSLTAQQVWQYGSRSLTQLTGDAYAEAVLIYGLLTAGGATVEAATIVPPDGGSVTVQRGSSYHASEGRGLRWNSTVGHDLAAGVVTMTIYEEPSCEGDVVGEAIVMTVTGSTGAWVLSGDLSAARVNALAEYAHGLQIKVLLANGHPIILRRAVLDVE